MAYIGAATAAATTSASASAGTLSMASTSVGADQNLGVKLIGVNRTGGSKGAASVTCRTYNNTAASGAQYSAVNTALHWASGDAEVKYCHVPIMNASPFSGTKTFYVEISGASGAALGSTKMTTVSIYGDMAAASVSLSAATYTAAQNQGSLSITVTRSGYAGNKATVGYATGNKTAASGSDYTAERGVLKWNYGDAATKTFVIPISNAKPFAGTKTLAVALASPTNATMGKVSSAIVTINGDAKSVAAVAPTPPAPIKSGSSAGFYITNGQLYDSNGNAFRIRGVNRVHWDSTSAAGIVKSGANTTRWDIDFTRSAAANVSLVQSDSVNNGVVPIVGNWTATCGNDTSQLSTIVSTWVSQAAQWTTLNKYMIVNIANEWGPRNSTVWRDSYISAIASLRAAGYRGTILIDAGGCGQDMPDLLNYSAAVFRSDSESNVMFALHVYGGDPAWTAANLAPGLAQLAALSKSVGMVFIVGEFGPGRDIGPSPTMVTPGQVITAAEASGIGWLAWAWDDNDLSNSRADDSSFSMTYVAGIYNTTADLTIYGKDVVLNPTYGITALSKRASIF